MPVPAQPARHGAVGAPEPGEADGVYVYLAYVNDEDVARLRALDVYAAAGGVAGAQLSVQLVAVGMVVEPGAAV